MSKSSKLGSKLKCMLRRWHSSSSRVAGKEEEPGHGHGDDTSQRQQRRGRRSRSFDGDAVPAGCRPVYVGKSRRRFLVSAELVEHPLFQKLLESSSPPVVVGCEVVLFEHMLWMLENADPKPESLGEIVELYAC